METQPLPKLPEAQLVRSESPRRLVPGRVFGRILEGIQKPEPLFHSQKEAVVYMEERITQRRNDFIEEYKKGFHGTTALTYEPALDREVYKELRKHKMRHTDAYKEVLGGLNRYTRDQVYTFIGERLNVGLSKFRYDLHFTNDGVGILYGQGMNESLLDMIARGRDTRNEITSDIDHPRQVAEVTQFEKIQEVLGDPDAAIGTTVISFSPPGKEGSSYAHNFYDVFILKEDQVGEKYVEARRYASGLSLEQSLQKAGELQPGYTQELHPDEGHIDAFLISHPLVITEGHEYFNNADALHQSLQGDPNAMCYEDFQKKVVKDEVFERMVEYYLQTLEERPDDKRLLDRTLNAIMNRADDAAGVDKPIRTESRTHMPSIRQRDYRYAPPPIMAQINDYGTREVRETSTGCGASGGFGQENSKYNGYGSSRLPGNMSLFKSSSAMSGEDKYGGRTFECPDCHETNVRPYNELLPRCQHCGSEKVAC